MWADNETSLDLINVRHLVEVVADTIRNDALLPITIGVFGGWGQGKSSLLLMIRHELEADSDVLCVSFNGWLFESYDDAKSALMGSILEEIRERRTLGPKALAAFKRLTSRINWFRTMSLAGKGALTLATGGGDLAMVSAFLAGGRLAMPSGEQVEETVQAVADAADEVKGVVKDSDEVATDTTIQTVRGFRDDFVELLAETDVKTLVVFIDELDRCLPNAVVETLEAIRLFLFVERTVFVIGADEELVRHAVTERFQHERLRATEGGRYLEKMIQVPFRIPPMGPREMQTYMNLLFTRLHTSDSEFEGLVNALEKESKGDFGEIHYGYGQAVALLETVPPELSESFVLTEQIGGVLTQGLSGNPRQLKRFLNMLILRLRLAKHRGLELSLRPLGKLMLLEYFHPERFRELARWRSAGEADLPQLRDLEFAALERRTASGEPAAEGSAEEGADADGPEATGGARLPDDLRAWLEHEPLLGWLQAEPKLGDIDLRPYFYITREQTTGLGSSLVDLSPPAAEVLRKLRSESEAMRRQAENAAEDLSPVEAGGVLRKVAEDIRQADQLSSSREPPLASLLGLVAARPDLCGELSPLLLDIPPQRLPIGIVPAIEGVLKGSHGSDLRATLNAWVEAKPVAAKLGAAAEAAIKRLESGA